jgi:uncharacterized protein with GYD domain
MATYVILSKLNIGALEDPSDFANLAASVSAKIKQDCPSVTWKDSYATMGQFDVVDIVESDDPIQVEKAAMIIRTHGMSNTQTLLATPWKHFLESL